MNRECHGDWVPSLRMYRCIWDGNFVNSEKKPAVCPNCNRNTFPKIVRRPKLRTVIMQQVEIRNKYQTHQIEFKPVK